MSYRVRYWTEIGKFSPGKKEFTKVAPGVKVSNTDMGYSHNLVIVSIIGDSYMAFTTAKMKLMMERFMKQPAPGSPPSFLAYLLPTRSWTVLETPFCKNPNQKRPSVRLNGILPKNAFLTSQSMVVESLPIDQSTATFLN